MNGEKSLLYWENVINRILEYSKTCVKRPLNNRQNKDFNTDL